MLTKPVARNAGLWKTVLAQCMAVLDVEYSHVRSLSAFDDPLAGLLLAEVVRAHQVVTRLIANGPVGSGDWLLHLRQLPLFACTVFVRDQSVVAAPAFALLPAFC